MINPNRGILRIGTSGIVVPGNKQSFPLEYQRSSRLSYYASLFNTLEINSTFRKIPMISTFEKWSLEVPEDFEFTLKLWQEITHVKQLNIAYENIDIFFKAAKNIGNKKGCLLVQFPGSITAGYSSVVEKILLRLHELDNANEWRKAIEFRSTSWYTSDTYNLVDKYNASIVLHDMPKSKNFATGEAAKFIYIRYHGPKGDYRGSYTNEFLEEQAANITTYLNDGKDVYVYFNNTMGSAFDNAMSLKAMLTISGF